MPDNIQKIKNKRLKEEFWNHPMYSDRNDIEYYNENKKDYENRPAFVQSGPAVAPGAPSIYGYMELDYPRIGFYTLIPGNNPNPKHEYLEEYIGKPALYRWTKGDGFFNSKHYPEVTKPGEANYPRIVQEFVTLSNMAGHPSYVGQSPELSKQLPELVIMPNQKYFIVRQQNGGIMRRLVPKHQQGNRVTRIPLKRNLWQILTGEHPYIDAIFHKDGATQRLTFDKVDSRDKREPLGDYTRTKLFNGQLSYPAKVQPSWRTTLYGTEFGSRERTEELEREATDNYIQQHNGELPWWYEGSPENPYELDGLTVTSKGTPFTRAYDWYNSGYRQPYRLVENVSIDQNGNDSITSGMMINPQGNLLYNIGPFAEKLSQKGESLFNNRLIRKNNTPEAKQKFIEDYKKSKRVNSRPRTWNYPWIKEGEPYVDMVDDTTAVYVYPGDPEYGR